MKKKHQVTILAVIIILVFISGYFFSDFLKKQNRIKEIKEYKKGFYEGLICQYSCPLSPQNYSNKTRMLPDVECIKACNSEFKSKYSSFSITKEEIENDDLIKDISITIDNCKKNTINLTLVLFNNTEYFNCVSNDLEKLKEKYNYLN